MIAAVIERPAVLPEPAPVYMPPPVPAQPPVVHAPPVYSSPPMQTPPVQAPPSFVGLAPQLVFSSPPPVPAATSEAPAPLVQNPPAAVVASGEEPIELLVTTYPVERCAAIAASIARSKSDKEAILERHDLAPDVWTRLDNHWRQAVEHESQGGNMGLLRAYDAAYVDQVEAERGPITVDEYARLTIAMDNGIDHGVLAELGLPRAAPLRVQRVWLERLSRSKELAASLRDAIERVSLLNQRKRC